MDDGDEPGIVLSHNTSSGSKSGGDKMFSLKKWNAVAMWSWDVECDTCAICRVQVMGESGEQTVLVSRLASLARKPANVAKVANICTHAGGTLSECYCNMSFVDLQTLVSGARRKTNRRTVLVSNKT